VLALGLLALALAGCGSSEPAPAGTSSAAAESSRAKPPPLPDFASAEKHLARIQAKRRPRPKPARPDPASMPPASAGTNGSFTPPPPAERQKGTPGYVAQTVNQAPGRVSVMLNDIALAPARAPTRVQAAVDAANTLVGQPYVWGGGHGSWYSHGYDCSGSVSFALRGAGLLSSPLTSSGLMRWGAPGPGRWITVYANPGHTYAVIAGLRWDTAGEDKGSGPRWHVALPYPAGFVARHPPGL
jgi:cell wall-associated NlpC family hydrolase